MLDVDRYSALSFDCYGTLIDWETGLLRALRPLLSGYGVALPDERVLGLYAELEAAAEAGEYIPYREVLRRVVQGLGARLGFQPAEYELNGLASSLGQWRPFPDTAEALLALAQRYRLAIVSNIDDELFAISAQLLPVEFSWIVTAEQARAYKPAARVFEYALRKMDLPPTQVLHVAQSRYHDIAPASRLRLTTVWVNRCQGRAGATPPAQARADLEVPDLATLVTALGLTLPSERTLPLRYPVIAP